VAWTGGAGRRCYRCENLEVEWTVAATRFAAEYGYSLPNVINLLDPKSGRRAPAAESKTSTRKPRQVKIYKNPNTGEVVETKVLSTSTASR
jgi:hypothetical protein